MSLTARSKYFRTFSDNFVYLYPEVDLEAALAVTQQPYTFDGTNIVCPTLANISALCYDIWYRSYLSYPTSIDSMIGGYYIVSGTIMEDLGKEIQFSLPSGEVVLRWRLVRQLTSQPAPTLNPPRKYSPVGTIGYVPVFRAMGSVPAPYSDIDLVLVVRLG